MKNIFAVSVLAATALAGYGPMTKSHHQPKDVSRRVMCEEWEVEAPEEKCMDFYTAWEDESCMDQWIDFDDYCEWTCEGWEVCDKVFTDFYSQDIDWNYPDMVDAECISHIDYMSEECYDAWYTTYNQCYMDGDYWGIPYMWTDMCDATIAIKEAHEIFDFAHENDMSLALNRLKNMKKNNPQKYAAI